MLLRRFANNLLKLTGTRAICNSEIRCNEKADEGELSGSVGTKFQVFRNEDSGIILDIEEERKQIDKQTEEPKKLISVYETINLKRGVSGVFEIEDLVDILKKENAIDMTVIRVPAELKYVDYLCIVTGNSYRHMLGMAHFVRKVYKLKRHSTDIIPKVEGENCKQWMALDLGNIALHIFERKSRQSYDLETLWTLGEEYEKRIRGNKVEELYQIYMPEAPQPARIVSDSIS